MPNEVSIGVDGSGNRRFRFWVTGPNAGTTNGLSDSQITTLLSDCLLYTSPSPRD